MFWAVLVMMATMSHADTVVARVSGEPVTLAEVSARSSATGSSPVVALDGVINEILLAQAAREEGFAARSEIKAHVAAERRRIALQRLVETDVYPRIEVPDVEVASLFHARADQVRLSMIVRETPEEAMGVLERLRRGESLLDEAKNSSDPLIVSKSGVLGWVSRGELAPALARVAFAAPLLRPAGIVPVPGGFAVLLAHERRIGNEAALATDAPDLRRSLALSKRDEAIEHYARGLRRRRHATVDLVFLRTTGDAFDGAGGEIERVVAKAGRLTVRYREVLAPLRDAADSNPHGSRRAPPELKERLAWQILDRLLLEDEAARRHFGLGPEVVQALERYERTLLANVYARATASNGEGAPVRHGVKDRLQELRAKAHVLLDETALGSL